MNEKKFSNGVENAPKFSERGKRIAQIREYFCHGDNTKFSEMLGTSPTFTSGICNGQKGAGEKLLDSILAVFPQVNKVWLYFGEGDMLVGGEQAELAFIKSRKAVSQPPQDSNVSREDIRQLMATLATLTEANSKQTEQIGRLIELLAQK